MRKIAAFLSTLLVASVHGHSHQNAKQSTWPSINAYTTFKLSGSVFAWANGQLVSYQGATTQWYVDGDRSKWLVKDSINVPNFGTVYSDTMMDFKQGYAINHVPFLGICERT